jgi:chemotaxis protein methyltransferase CheR
MSSKPNTAVPAGLEQAWTQAVLADEDYQFICNLVYEHSRIHLGKDKKVLVTSRLSKRLRFHKLAGYRDYCELLRSRAGAEELTVLIDSISTNHTHFFREMKHFDFLRDKLLPAWTAQAAGKTEPLRVWSAASSTGEEPYTIAIHLAENLAPPESGAWSIDASDISTRVLEIARQGVYDAERLAGVTPEMLRRYFQKGTGKWEGHFRVKDSMRRRVAFHHLNLLEANYPFSKPFQVIFCRNVMIYFDRPTQETLVKYLSDRLVPGGHLLVGHSESLSGVKHNLRLVQPAVYVKP